MEPVRAVRGPRDADGRGRAGGGTGRAAPHVRRLTPASPSVAVPVTGALRDPGPAPRRGSPRRGAAGRRTRRSHGPPLSAGAGGRALRSTGSRGMEPVRATRGTRDADGRGHAGGAVGPAGPDAREPVGRGPVHGCPSAIPARRRGTGEAARRRPAMAVAPLSRSHEKTRFGAASPSRGTGRARRGGALRRGPSPRRPGGSGPGTAGKRGTPTVPARETARAVP